MNINWKIRIKNPIFWTQIILAIFAPIFAYMGITAKDLTTWSMLGETLLNAISNPYIVVSILVSVWGVINDPTSTGITDSSLALSYDELNDNKGDI